MQWTIDNVPIGTKIFQDGVEITHVIEFDPLFYTLRRYVTDENGEIVHPKAGEEWFRTEELQLVGAVTVVFPERRDGV